MIIIGSGWHAYFSIYTQFDFEFINLCIFLSLQSKFQNRSSSASVFYAQFHICLMDVHVHNGWIGVADLTNARTSDSIYFVFCVCVFLFIYFLFVSHSQFCHPFSFNSMKRCAIFFLFLSQSPFGCHAHVGCFIKERPIKLSYHYINWPH